MPVQYGGDKITFSDGSTVGSGWSGFKNRIINGDMQIDQRNAGASVSVSNGVVTYITDRWNVYEDTSGSITAQQSTTTPAGFTNAFLTTVTSAGTATGGQLARIQQRIEGFNIADLAWGTASAQPITVSFWVRSSLTGTYCVSIRNSAVNRSYVATYTISSANTYEYKTVTIPGDTSGTWLTNNGVGLYIDWDLGSGSNYNTTAGSWVSADRIRTSDQANWIGTNGATFFITGVQLERGSTATSFDYLPYGTELALCQRYFQIVGGTSTEHFAPGVMSATRINIVYGLKQTMRAAPSWSATSFGSSFGDLTVYYGTGALSITGTNENYMSPNNISIGFNHGGSTTAGGAGYIYFNSTNARIAFTAEL